MAYFKVLSRYSFEYSPKEAQRFSVVIVKMETMSFLGTSNTGYNKTQFQ